MIRIINKFSVKYHFNAILSYWNYEIYGCNCISLIANKLYAVLQCYILTTHSFQSVWLLRTFGWFRGELTFEFNLIFYGILSWRFFKFLLFLKKTWLFGVNVVDKNKKTFSKMSLVYHIKPLKLRNIWLLRFGW